MSVAIARIAMNNTTMILLAIVTSAQSVSDGTITVSVSCANNATYAFKVTRGGAVLPVSTAPAVLSMAGLTITHARIAEGVNLKMHGPVMVVALMNAAWILAARRMIATSAQAAVSVQKQT